MVSVESISLLLHSFLSLLSLSTSALLVYVVMAHTPSAFSTFGVMLKFHALIDFYVALGFSACLQRVISIDRSLILMSSGIGENLGGTGCWIACMMLMGGSSLALYNVLASFVFRLFVIRGTNPTKRDALKLIFAISLPIPVISSARREIVFLVARGDDAELRAIINEKLPEYEADAHTITGVLDVGSISAKVYLTPVMVQVWPVYTAILILRKKILAGIDQQSAKLSDKSKRMQRKFVTMLSAQAAVPVAQCFAVGTFIIGFFDIVHHPMLEIVASLVGESIGFLSPTIVLYSIDHYRSALQEIFCSAHKAKSSVRTVSTSVI